VFLLFCFLRGLKFLRIPPSVGPTALSILDTLKHQNFIVFILIFVFVIFTFSFTFHLSFGKYLYPLRDVQHSLVSIWPMLLGGIDYTQMEQTNRIFGPIFFLLFLFGCTIVLMNMFIAVISDVYINLQKENLDNWEYELSDTITKSIVLDGKITAVDYIVQWFLGVKKRLFPPPKKEPTTRVDLELLTIMGEGNSEEMKEISYSQIPTQSNITQSNNEGKSDLEKSTDSKISGSMALEPDTPVYEEIFKGYSKSELKDLQLKFRKQRKADNTLQQLHYLSQRQDESQELLRKMNGDLRMELDDIRTDMKLIAQKTAQEIHLFKSESKVLQQEIRALLESIHKK